MSAAKYQELISGEQPSTPVNWQTSKSEKPHSHNERILQLSCLLDTHIQGLAFVSAEG